VVDKASADPVVIPAQERAHSQRHP